MSTTSLEWTGPPGPAALTLLAGPWRRGPATADDPAEVFRLRLPGADALPPATDPQTVLASASERLLAALQVNGGDTPRSAAELQRTLARDSAGMSTDIGPLLAELTRRGLGLARVESELGPYHRVSTEISASGRMTTHILAAAPAELLTWHREAVAAALHTRATLLRTAITTAELAALIAAFAGPAAVGLALPLAWQFLHSLLSEHLTPSPGA